MILWPVFRMMSIKGGSNCENNNTVRVNCPYKGIPVINMHSIVLKLQELCL